MTTDTGREPTRRDLIDGWVRPVNWFTAPDDDVNADAQAARLERVRVEFDDAEARWREETYEPLPVAFAVDGGHAMMFEGDTARERILSDRYVEDVQ